MSRTAAEAHDDGEAPHGPLVSVVVATNRAGPYLGEALTSVAAQTWPKVELVIVDDGAPDADAVVRAAAAVPDARVVRQEPAGVSRARNHGAGLAAGELLTFLDDDDRWHPDRLAKQVAAMQTAPGVVASYCRMQTVDETGTRVLAPADQTPVRSQADIAARRTGIIAPNLMVRREAFHAVGGFAPELQHAEDLDLVLHLADLGDFAFASEALVDYRAHGENTTGRYRDLVCAIDAVLREHRRRAVRRGDDELVSAFDESLRRNGRFAWWSAVRAARTAVGGGHPFAAGGELWWALRTAPRALFDKVGLRRR